MQSAICLSIHQPWAWAIFHAGKSIENRHWATSYRGPLLIHASKTTRTYDAIDPGEWLDWYGIGLPSIADLPRGAIIGQVDLMDCCRRDSLFHRPELNTVWAEGPVCWILANARSFKMPVPYKGQQGLFSIPIDPENPWNFA